MSFKYLVQLIEHPIFLNPEFQFSQFKVLQSGFFLFIIVSYIGFFGHILILILIQNSKKVTKVKNIHRKIVH